MREVETFACNRYRSWLTPAACASRRTRARRRASGKAKHAPEAVRIQWCVACPIGEAHARGERPTDLVRRMLPVVA